MKAYNPALNYNPYEDVCTDDHEAKLHTFVPHAVAELHKQGLWKSVCAEDGKCQSRWNSYERRDMTSLEMNRMVSAAR